MEGIIRFLDVHNGSLMVIITLMYVLATILICYFNGKSAKATQDQIKESRKQYEETKRLQMMPVLQFRDSQCSGHYSAYCSLVVTPADETSSGCIYPCDVSISIKNIGLGSMKEATYFWTDGYGLQSNRGSFPVESLCAGEEANLTISFECYHREVMIPEEKLACQMDLRYKDLLENEYAQKVTFTFEIQDPKQCFDCSPLLFREYSVSKVKRI